MPLKRTGPDRNTGIRREAAWIAELSGRGKCAPIERNGSVHRMGGFIDIHCAEVSGTCGMEIGISAFSLFFDPVNASKNLNRNGKTTVVFCSTADLFVYGLIATLRTPSSRSPNIRYPSLISSSEKVWVSSGVKSTRLPLTTSIKRRIRSLPPGQSVVAIR